MSAAPRGVAEKARKAALLYLAGGVSQGALAERFGISKGSISVAVREVRRERAEADKERLRARELDLVAKLAARFPGIAGALESMGNSATLVLSAEARAELMDLERERVSSEIRDHVTNAGDTGNIGRHDHNEER